MTCPVSPGADNCFRSVRSCSSAPSAPTGRTLESPSPAAAKLHGPVGDWSVRPSVTHALGVQDPAFFPCTIALCPCPSHHRLRSRRRCLLAGSDSSAPRGLSARSPGGSRGAGQARGLRGRGARLLRGARPWQTESGERTRGAPPIGPPASDFR